MKNKLSFIIFTFVFCLFYFKSSRLSWYLCFVYCQYLFSISINYYRLLGIVAKLYFIYMWLALLPVATYLHSNTTKKKKTTTQTNRVRNNRAKPCMNRVREQAYSYCVGNIIFITCFSSIIFDHYEFCVFCMHLFVCNIPVFFQWRKICEYKSLYNSKMKKDSIRLTSEGSRNIAAYCSVDCICKT